ncbi:SecD/SecF fusion protein [Aneurinibacillus thermoaerophilus]|uniref:Protein translocase subunit SecD n=2 Tax=Aneurinibacillus thermoaerophilus TaxID=143495 RepID=A0A1G7YBU3_ANETH|nr:SecD/SecF fusion protein [Aneurinibacillus thermoaerophilus]
MRKRKTSRIDICHMRSFFFLFLRMMRGLKDELVCQLSYFPLDLKLTVKNKGDYNRVYWLKKEEVRLMINWSRIVTFLLITLLVFGVIGVYGEKVAKSTTLGLDLRGGFEILYEVSPLEPGAKMTQQTVKDAVYAIERRVNVLGVTEPEITVEGTNRIRVKLAGVHDQEQARNVIGKPANLTFRDMQGHILMKGSDLAENGAKGVLDPQTQQPVVTLQFKDAKKFAEVTQKYVGQPMGIYLDEKMLTAPTIREVIPNGSAQIDGQESIQEAKNLAALLNAGALPVKMKEVFSTSVGAKLGTQSLQNGIKAGVIGIALVYIFMLAVYRLPGVIACIMISAYMFLLLLVQNLMDVTLTLPGIAAFILGVGMAVDANIIMYERIKEELRSGKTILSALRVGSQRSLSTILDANITTIIAALVLFQFGSSSVKGFAVILILSIVMSMLTSVVGSRLLLNLVVRSNLFKKPAYFGVRERDIREL